MRPVSISIPAILFLSASSLGAQTMPYPQADTAPVSTVVVTAVAKPVRIYEDQARQIAGMYEMSNGWRLKATSKNLCRARDEVGKILIST